MSLKDVCSIFNPFGIILDGFFLFKSVNFPNRKDSLYIKAKINTGGANERSESHKIFC